MPSAMLLGPTVSVPSELTGNAEIPRFGLQKLAGPIVRSTFREILLLVPGILNLISACSRNQAAIQIDTPLGVSTLRMSVIVWSLFFEPEPSLERSATTDQLIRPVGHLLPRFPHCTTQVSSGKSCWSLLSLVEWPGE